MKGGENTKSLPQANWKENYRRFLPNASFFLPTVSDESVTYFVEILKQ
jgi:hypothetical protein